MHTFWRKSNYGGFGGSLWVKCTSIGRDTSITVLDLMHTISANTYAQLGATLELLMTNSR